MEKNKETYILHLSDLHLKKHDGTGTNMSEAILNHVEQKLANVSTGHKLLILTGDFHNYAEGDYTAASDFVKELIKRMAIDPRKDVFMVPGNHDVTAKEKMSPKDQLAQEAVINHLRNTPKVLNKDYLKIRLDAFEYYCKFAKDLGVYDASMSSPASVHMRTWRDRLNILHLNTVLVADGNGKDNQMLDISSVDYMQEQLHKQELPGIAIGHNSFYDLHKDQQEILRGTLIPSGIKAYLCGDRHQIIRDPEEFYIHDSIKNESRCIGNIVGYKGAADGADDFSEFGLIWHIWDERTDEVKLEGYEFDAQRQSDLKQSQPYEDFTYSLNLSSNVTTVMNNKHRESQHAKKSDVTYNTGANIADLSESQIEAQLVSHNQWLKVLRESEEDGMTKYLLERMDYTAETYIKPQTAYSDLYKIEEKFCRVRKMHLNRAKEDDELLTVVLQISPPDTQPLTPFDSRLLNSVSAAA